jgi:hypothetical protein
LGSEIERLTTTPPTVIDVHRFSSILSVAVRRRPRRQP